MLLKTILPILLISLFHFRSFTQGLNYTLSKDSAVNRLTSYKRVYTTIRTEHKPKIDGLLNDYCWVNEGYWEGDFIQQMPRQAHPPTQKTEIKILFDNDNIYMAIKCHDTVPNGIMKILGRRDDITLSDVSGIALDTYHDKRTAFEFNVTAAGQKIDLMHLGDYLWDFNWNAVWQGKSHVEDSIWTIEMLVPFSQIRFSKEKEQVWGMHVWRFISRNKEEDQWKLIPSEAPAMVYLFGELQGIKDIPQKRHFELLPYTTAGYRTNQGQKTRLGFGLDGKAALSSNFTLDYTVLPDFGQVEADPSQLNLSSYEVFFEEKRPFFLEGNAILEYGIGKDMLFYSRRIGHAPTLYPVLSGNQAVDMPSATNILNSIKITGKNKHGFSMGVVNSMTQREFADIREGNNKQKFNAEPFSNYFVARAKQDLNKGNTAIGGMFTSVSRVLKTEDLKNYLPSQSFSGGIDILHSWKNRKYYVDLKSFASNLSGSKQSISRIQQLPIHLFQRVDAPHLGLDDGVTQMSGWGGDLQGGKGSGKIRATASVSWRSPGLDLNDVGYLREADVISQKATLKYMVTKPAGIVQNYTLMMEQRHDWSFGAENTYDGLEGNGKFTFTNLWELVTSLSHCFNILDTRQLRGGPALRKEPFSLAGFVLHSNTNKKFWGGLGLEQIWSKNTLSYSTSYKLNFQGKLSDRFIITSNTVLEKIADNNQYVPSPTLNIAGRIDRKTLYTSLRVEYFISPELSVQYYGSPYSSVGKFQKIYKVVDAHSIDQAKRYQTLSFVNQDNDYQYYRDDNSPPAIWKITKPDFNFQEFRSNFVVRWEYKAGSTFYFVWAHNRSRYESLYNPDVLGSFSDIGSVRARNTLMIKFNYWFTL